MDQRQTFNNDNELLSIIEEVYNKKMRAYLLVDRGGLTRLEGNISEIEQSDNTKTTCIRIDGTDSVLLPEIIALNGIFRSDYSEC